MKVPNEILKARQAYTKISNDHMSLPSMTKDEATDHSKETTSAQIQYLIAVGIASQEKMASGVDHGVEDLRDQQKSLGEYATATEAKLQTYKQAEKRQREDVLDDDNHREKRQKSVGEGSG